MNPSQQIPDLTASRHADPEVELLRGREFVTRVFAWMFLGLLTTAGIGYWFSESIGADALAANAWVFIVLIVAMLGLVFFLSARIQTLSHGVAVFMFLLITAIMGAFLSSIFVTYTTGSIAVTFAVTATMFGSMAFLGAVLKMDLTRFGSILLMALIGFIVGTIVNLIWFNETIYWVLTGIGILIFCGLTSYDMQRIVNMSREDADSRLAITGALSLYLDFINLFLLLLRIFGRR